VVSIVNKKSRATKKNRAPSILYPLCSRISLFESPYCFEAAIHKRVVQLVQVVLIGPLRIFSMLASRSFKNALRRRGSHLTWTRWSTSGKCTEKFNIVDHRLRHVTKH